MKEKDIKENYSKVLRDIEYDYYPDYEYFRPYLKHFCDVKLSKDDMCSIQYTISELYRTVRNHISGPKQMIITPLNVIKTMVTENPMCLHTKHAGLKVKLYRIHTLPYSNKRHNFILKIYLFENKKYAIHSDTSYMYSEMIKTNIMNEIVFQKYAEKLQKYEFDFIVPEIYDYGSCNYKDITEDGKVYRCYYILMEYIEGITLKEALLSKGYEEMYEVVEKVKKIDHMFKTNMLHHNDMHSNNVLVLPTENNGTSRVAIIDYGEAAYGPRHGLPKDGRF